MSQSSSKSVWDAKRDRLGTILGDVHKVYFSDHQPRRYDGDLENAKSSKESNRLVFEV